VTTFIQHKKKDETKKVKFSRWKHFPSTKYP